MAKDLRGENKLAYQAIDGDEAGLAQSLELGLDPMARDGAGRTPLMWAAWEAQAPCARILLAVSDARAVDGAGNTALMFAAASGDRDCVDLLLGASDVLAANEKGQTARAVAVDMGQLDLARELADRERAAKERADISTQTNSLPAIAGSRAFRL